MDGERAPRRPHALRGSEGRLRSHGCRVRLVRRRRRRPAGALAQAPARRRRAAAVAVDRLSPGGRPDVTRPLEGIKVVEAATLFAAPLASMLLGDFGADVVKIEHPSRPDPARGHGASKDGIGLWFKTLSRNKRLITLSLSTPGGRDVFLRLVERSD